MKKIKLSLLLLIFFTQSSLIISGDCIVGSSKIKTEQRNLAPFSTVNIKGAYTLSIKCQPKQYLRIIADDNILKNIITKVNNGNLSIYIDKPICIESEIKIDIGIYDIQKLVASGSQNIDVLNVSNESFKSEIDGAIKVNISGSTKKFNVLLSGAVELYAKNFKSEILNIDVQGSGNAEIFVSKKLVVNISGMGDVIYYGNPSEITKEISGVGEIKKGEY